MGPMSSGDGRDPDPGTRARGPGPADLICLPVNKSSEKDR